MHCRRRKYGVHRWHLSLRLCIQDSARPLWAPTSCGWSSASSVTQTAKSFSLNCALKSQRFQIVSEASHDGGGASKGDLGTSAEDQSHRLRIKEAFRPEPAGISTRENEHFAVARPDSYFVADDNATGLRTSWLDSEVKESETCGYHGRFSSAIPHLYAYRRHPWSKHAARAHFTAQTPQNWHSRTTIFPEASIDKPGQPRWPGPCRTNPFWCFLEASARDQTACGGFGFGGRGTRPPRSGRMLRTPHERPTLCSLLAAASRGV